MVVVSFTQERRLLHVMQFIIRVLRLCYNANEKGIEEARVSLEKTGVVDGASQAPWTLSQAPLGALVPHNSFYSRAVSNLPEQLLRVDYERWRATGFKRSITTPIVLCHYPFLFDAAAKRKLLLYEAALQMSSEAAHAMMRSAVLGIESPFLDLEVRVLASTIEPVVLTTALHFTVGST